MPNSVGLRAWKTFLRQQKRGWLGLDKTGAGLLARRYIRALAYLFNLHTLILMAVACLAVAACYEWDFRWVDRTRASARKEDPGRECGEKPCAKATTQLRFGIC